MKIRLLMICIAGIVMRNPALAQPAIEKHEEIMESLAESIENLASSQSDYESVLEDLEYLFNHPLNVNTASYADLQKLPFLTDFQIQSLLRYREENGNLLTLYELQLVHGFANETISQMIPYVVAEAPVESFAINVRDIPYHLHGEITLNFQRTIEEASGYEEGTGDTGIRPYPGNPWRYYVKTGFRMTDKINAGFTMEKDPGEYFCRGSNPYGFDFYSAHLMIQEVGRVNTFVMGDYRLQFGQGLTLWNGFSPGKSSLPLNIIKRQDGLKRFTSVEENNFFRGVAATCQLGKFHITGFYSSKSKDANIADTLGSGLLVFSSFLASGTHRTNHEIQDEKSVHERAFGSNITFRGNVLKLGVTCIEYQFDSYLEKSDKPYKAFDFYGSSLLNAGLDYTVTLNNIQLAGEISYGNQSFATTHSAVFHAGKYASMAVLYRYFPASFYSLYSASFSEGSRNSNENGLYLGTVIHPAPRWSISAYADFYRFPWLRYRVNAPSSGSDYMVTITYAPDRNVEMMLRFRYESDQVNQASDSQLIDDLVRADYTGLRFHISYRHSDALTLRTRIEHVGVKTKEGHPEKGFMLYQDIQWQFRKIPAILSFRYAWFDTDNYSARIYTYELQTLPSFTGYPLYDKGYRTYIMMRYNLSDKVSCWVRLARTWYSDKTTIGSGYDQILSNIKHDIKFQAVIRF